MKTVTIDEIQRDLPGYLQRVQAGETLLVTEADEPLAEIKPVGAAASSPDSELRPIGLCGGPFVAPEDFDAPLPESILRDFEGR